MGAEESLPSYKAWAKENGILMPKTRKESRWIRSRLATSGCGCDFSSLEPWRIDVEASKMEIDQLEWWIWSTKNGDSTKRWDFFPEDHRNAPEIHGSLRLIHGGSSMSLKVAAICGRDGENKAWSHGQPDSSPVDAKNFGILPLWSAHGIAWELPVSTTSPLVQRWWETHGNL